MITARPSKSVSLNLMCNLATLTMLIVLLSVLLSACGDQRESRTTESASANPAVILSVSLTGSNAPSTEKADAGENLIDLAERWQNWSGAVSDVVYDPVLNALRLPGRSDEMVIGVRRFDQPLAAGVQYTLSVSASNQDAAALLFLFDQFGWIVAVAGAGPGNLAFARNANPLVFTAPENVAGFYLQVQNQWHAPDESILSAQLRAEFNPGPGSRNLVRLSGAWPDWSGTESAVGLDPTGTQLEIQPPVNGQGQTLGIRRFSVPLTAGDEYQLAVESTTDPNAAVLLFLIDTSGQIVPFSDPAGGASLPWLAATGSQTQNFVVPAGIAGYVVQVQSAWNATTVANMVPSLREAGSGLSCKPVLDSSTLAVKSEAGAYPFGQPAISDDGKFVVFGSTSSDLIAGETDSNRAFADIFLFNRITGLTERVTPGTNTGPDASVPPTRDGPAGPNFATTCPCSISADGQVVVFSSTDNTLIAGEADANGATRDIFVFDRRSAQIERVTPGTSASGSFLPSGTGYTAMRHISGDGQDIVFLGVASELIPGEAPSSGARQDVLIFNRVTRQITRVTPAAANGGHSLGSISADGRYIAFTSEANNLIPNDFDANGDVTDVFRYDRETAQIERLTPGTADEGYVRPSISADGRIIVFDSFPGNAAGSQSLWEIFDYDFGTEQLNWLSATQPAGFWNIDPSVSANGQVVVFRQVFGQAPIYPDVLVIYDRPSGEFLSLGSDINASSPSLSASGRVLAYRGGNSVDGFGIYIAQLTYPCDP